MRIHGKISLIEGLLILLIIEIGAVLMFSANGTFAEEPVIKPIPASSTSSTGTIKNVPEKKPLRYKVEAGDAISVIATRHGASSKKAISWFINEVTRLNRLENPDLIHPGQILVLPGVMPFENFSTPSSPEKISVIENAFPETIAKAVTQDKQPAPKVSLKNIPAQKRVRPPKNTKPRANWDLVSRAEWIFDEYGAIIMTASAESKVPPEYICGTIIQESGGHPLAIGDRGHSHGIMQLHRPTRIDLGLTVLQALTPSIAIPAATKLLRRHYDAFGQDTEAAISAYNAPRITQKMLAKGQNPGTREYVRGVLANAQACKKALAT